MPVRQTPAGPILDVHSYAQGGLVGPGGAPSHVPPAAAGGLGAQTAQPAQMSPQVLEMQIQEILRKNPQAIATIQEAMQKAMESGQLTPDELNQAVQLAQMALNNPQMWPRLRQHAIQQGLADDNEIPQQFDQGLVIALLIAGRALQQGGGASPVQQNQEPVRELPQGGGALPAKSANPDGSVPIKAHEGEYVVPPEVVRAKGTEFFDKLVDGVRNPKGTKA